MLFPRKNIAFWNGPIYTHPTPLRWVSIFVVYVMSEIISQDLVTDVPSEVKEIVSDLTKKYFANAQQLTKMQTMGVRTRIQPWQLSSQFKADIQLVTQELTRFYLTPQVVNETEKRLSTLESKLDSLIDALKPPK